MRKMKILIRLIGAATRKCGRSTANVLNRTKTYFENDGLIAAQMDQRLSALIEEQRRDRYQNRCLTR